jgi:hypothetical protein
VKFHGSRNVHVTCRASDRVSSEFDAQRSWHEQPTSVINVATLVIGLRTVIYHSMPTINALVKPIRRKFSWTCHINSRKSPNHTAPGGTRTLESGSVGIVYRTLSRNSSRSENTRTSSLRRLSMDSANIASFLLKRVSGGRIRMPRRAFTVLRRSNHRRVNTATSSWLPTLGLETWTTILS